MLNLFSLSLIIFLISFIIMIISSVLSKKPLSDREKMSPFECGFDPLNSARIPFSIHFFIITIIFLIFDIEISLILPMILTFNISNIFSWMFTSMIFMIILLMGIFHEWNEGALNWVK